MQGGLEGEPEGLNSGLAGYPAAMRRKGPAGPFLFARFQPALPRAKDNSRLRHQDHRRPKTVEEQPIPQRAADQFKSNNVSETGTSMLTNFHR